MFSSIVHFMRFLLDSLKIIFGLCKLIKIDGKFELQHCRCCPYLLLSDPLLHADA